MIIDIKKVVAVSMLVIFSLPITFSSAVAIKSEKKTKKSVACAALVDVTNAALGGGTPTYMETYKAQLIDFIGDCAKDNASMQVFPVTQAQGYVDKKFPVTKQIKKVFSDTRCKNKSDNEKIIKCGEEVQKKNGDDLGIFIGNMDPKNTKGRTAEILTPLYSAARALEQTKAQSKRLLVLSPGIQIGTGMITFDSPYISTENAQALVDKSGSAGLIPSMKGIEVEWSGMGSGIIPVPDPSFLSGISAFWNGYFLKSGISNPDSYTIPIYSPGDFE